MERLLNFKKRMFIVMACISCGLYASAQSIVLPSVIDSLVDLKTFVSQPFSFNDNAIDSVNLFTGLNATHCKAQQDCGILPVYLLSFDGKRLDREHALLNWKTTNEINSKGFDVERALGNTHNFTKRGFVASLQGGSIEKKYSFTDENNYPGISYYRLKQIDNDGQFSYSEIVTVKGFSFDDNLLVYPNPTKDYLNISIYLEKSSAATLVVTDAAGKAILSKAVNLNGGVNYDRLLLTTLKSGVYTLKLQRTNGIALIKNFVKY